MSHNTHSRGFISYAHRRGGRHGRGQERSNGGTRQHRPASTRGIGLSTASFTSQNGHTTTGRSACGNAAHGRDVLPRRRVGLLLLLLWARVGHGGVLRVYERGNSRHRGSLVSTLVGNATDFFTKAANGAVWSHSSVINHTVPMWTTDNGHVPEAAFPLQARGQGCV